MFVFYLEFVLIDDEFMYFVSIFEGYDLIIWESIGEDIEFI